MKLNKKTILLILGVLYLLPGLLLMWSSGMIGASLLQALPTLLTLLLLWPVLIGGGLFYTLVIPGFISLLLVLFFLLKRKYIFAASLFLTLIVLFGSLLNQGVAIKNKTEQSPLEFRNSFN